MVFNIIVYEKYINDVSKEQRRSQLNEGALSVYTGNYQLIKFKIFERDVK